MTVPLRITSTQNQQIKDLVRLRRRQHRDRAGQILIDGAREVRAAIEAQLADLQLFACREMCHTDESQALLADATRGAFTLTEVTAEVFTKIRYGDRAEGVLAVAATPQTALTEITLPEQPLVAVLEGCEKPGNLGALIRSADAAGVDAVLAADPVIDLYNSNAIRASLGTIFSLPVCAASSSEILAWLRQQRLAIFTARVDGAVTYTEADFREGSAIVLGAESTGLTSAWQGEDLQAVCLPMRGHADSLNVSNTAAVLFYEARRQRDLAV